MWSRFRSRPVPLGDYRQRVHDDAMATVTVTIGIRGENPRPSRPRIAIPYTGAMSSSSDDAIEVQALKADSFGRIALMRDDHGLFVRRDLRHVPLWLRVPAWWLARREARALQ